ncbi:MAG: MarR family transcriptional regulator [Solobacterium sp.]|jgi:DNA-binding MarR family transcriptional regulator|nr:MarR family transcriptional regulator [Solobacterium sp.]MCH4221770.1 MarR family transcriptional regulator [Solobacterium sp.]MCH4266233.1 MarR family transcriptional regulator [Solobacterium sp.]
MMKITKDSPGAMMKVINQELQKDCNNSLRKLDVTVSQMDVLMALSEHEDGLNMKELEKILHLAQSTTAGIVTRLEQKRYITGSTDPEDRRVKYVKIAPEGIKVCQASGKDMVRSNDRILSGLSEAQQKEFLKLLKQVRDSIIKQ